MCYQLPKIWLGRIQKYWDKIMPAVYPTTDSVFALSFADPEEKAAVEEMEENLYKDDSVVLTLIPEGNYVKDYFGTYDVSYDGEVPEEGVYTLLSPEKINIGNNELTVLHFENGEWVKVEDAEIVDGYVYGTLKSFSPIAIITSKKEIHFETAVDGIKAVSSFIVCEGNPVLVTKNEAGNHCVINTNTGKEIEVTERTYVIGGSIDGSYIESTNVAVKGTDTITLINKIIGGSAYIGENFIEVGSVNIYAENAIVGAISGSFGAVRTHEVNIIINNCTMSWAGCGEAYAKVNVPPVSLASRAWTKKANWVINNSTIPLLYLSGNNEYYYVEANNAVINGGTYGYLINGGSNHATGSSVLDITDATVSIYQSTNRGVVDSTDSTFTNCTVDNLFIGGDATDKTVTGTTNNIKVDICKGGTYNIVNGTEEGHLLTQEDVDRIVKSVKVSRNANITIADEFKAMLGSKYIVK